MLTLVFNLLHCVHHIYLTAALVFYCMFLVFPNRL